MNGFAGKPVCCTANVQRQFSFCIIDLGQYRDGLFHLWEEARLVGADGWGDCDDGGFVRWGDGFNHVADQHCDYRGGLCVAEGGVLSVRVIWWKGDLTLVQVWESYRQGEPLP